MIKTKQELLNHFSDINEMYNNPFMYQTLSNMIDELLEQQSSYNSVKTELKPCEDCISREEAIRIASINSMPVNECVRLIKELPSVKPQQKIDEIIKRIEETRDKDKLCEYPYNRCIDIVREVLG